MAPQIDRPIVGKVVCGLSGALLLLYGIYLGPKPYRIIKTWPRVDAVVLGTYVAEQRSTNSRGLATYRYVPSVTLKYSLEGREYTRVTYPPSGSSLASARKVVDAFKPGTHHLVPYNPVHPRGVYPGVGWNVGTFDWPAIVLCAGLLFSLVALLVRS